MVGSVLCRMTLAKSLHEPGVRSMSSFKLLFEKHCIAKSKLTSAQGSRTAPLPTHIGSLHALGQMHGGWPHLQDDEARVQETVEEGSEDVSIVVGNAVVLYLLPCSIVLQHWLYQLLVMQVRDLHMQAKVVPTINDQADTLLQNASLPKPGRAHDGPSESASGMC
jgi:hypothetical protein